MASAPRSLASHKRSFSAERLDSKIESEGESLGSEGCLKDLTDSYLDAVGDLTEAMDQVAHLVAHIEAEDCLVLRQRLARWRNTLTHARARVNEVEARWWARHDEGLCLGKKKKAPLCGSACLARADAGPAAHAALNEAKAWHGVEPREVLMIDEMV